MTDMDRQIQTCLQDEDAFCTAACPFHLKTRDFIEKIRRGSFDAAYKAYRNAVGFPEIVAALCHKPCEAVCPYHKANASINLLALEKAAVSYAKNKKPTDYNIPAKNKKIAVVGAGISGLACALRMAEKRYEVTVFEQSARIGGSLWEMLPSGVFLAEIERQFMYVDYELRLNTKVNNLAELKAFDAVYIATGRNGDDFDLPKQPHNGFWLGGSILGVDKMTAIAQGLAAVNPIEWWLKTGAMKSFAEFSATRMQVDEAAWPKTEPVPVPAGGLFSREEAMAEAKRCTGCTCEFCHRACDLLAIYKLQQIGRAHV